MYKVKTFTNEIKILQAMNELRELDEKVNKFIEANDVKKVVSVSDTCTNDANGMTIGVIRVLTYK